MSAITTKLIGTDGLIDFGNYLVSLREDGHTSYTFELPTKSGALRDTELEEALSTFDDFVAGKTDKFRVGITYVDGVTMGYTERTFTRK